MPLCKVIKLYKIEYGLVMSILIIIQEDFMFFIYEDMRYHSGQNVVDSRETTKTFRFYDEDEYEI